MDIKSEIFGQTQSGKTVTKYTLTNSRGMEVSILDLGCIIQSIRTADKEGQFADVVLGCDCVADYEKQSSYIGCVAGRFANRISKGQLSIDGIDYQLACNNAPNHLHGGNLGFNKKIWRAKSSKTDDSASLSLYYLSVDGEEGYPGNLDLCVRYTLTNNNELQIDYRAITDKTTVVNLTNHSYFNLRGHGSCREHRLQLMADHFLPTGETAIPTGESAPVAGTPMDFTTMKAIGLDLDSDNIQIVQAKGFDHNWIINHSKTSNPEPTLFARVEEPESGRVMEGLTTQPGVQFYTGNYLNGEPGKDGKIYKNRDGFCLETQHYPDSPNQPKFPSTELKPGETYQHRTLFRFSTI